jgi:hypothetical protein
VLIEQAVFSSAANVRAKGYQLISRSRGLSETDARELALWGPAHDSLLEHPTEPASTNFHRLESGAFAVSRTTCAGAEYSGRGALVYTQFLVVPPEVLARFANNPFALVLAAKASGLLQVWEQIPETLEPVRLSGRAPAADPSLLAQVACRPGPSAMATLLQAALSSDQLAVASGTGADVLFAGLLNLLPVECRIEFSFSTGLKFSPSRPFRLCALPRDPAQWRAIGRHGVTLLDLDAAASGDDLCWEGWPGMAAEILRGGRISLLAAQLERSRPHLTCAGLQAFADEVVAQLHPAPRENAAASSERPHASEHLGEASTPGKVSDNGFGHRPDGAHPHFEPSAATSCSMRPTRCEQLADALVNQPPEVVELLERVDDLVFAAIGGDPSALAGLQELWPTVVADLEGELLEQSREQYLRCALSIWSECVEAQLRDPARAVSAIDVLCVLFNE